MGCSVNLFDVIQNEDVQDTLEFLFYDADQDGDADNGGSLIIIAADGSVNFDNVIAGDYYFKHTTGEGECLDELIFFIRVLDAPDAGTGTTIDLCNTDAPINIFSLISGTPDLTGFWTGSGIGNAGYSDNGTPNDPTDDTFDPTQSGIGLFTFIYNVAPVLPNGYQLAPCENCNTVTSTTTINVIDCSVPPPQPCNAGDSGSVQVCASNGCTFDLINYLNGTPTLGGQWTLLAGAPSQIIPVGSAGTVNFNNAAIGVYQYEYNLQNILPNCFDTAIVTVQVSQPNAGNNFATTLCDTAGAVNLFPLLGGAQSGGTWAISPGLPAGSFNNGVINPAVGDAGVYAVTYTVTSNTNNNPCGGNICTDIATGTVTIVANCNAGANVTTVVCDNATYTLNAITQLGASTNGGSYLVFGQSPTCNNVYGSAVFSVNGGSAINQQGNTLQVGDQLSNFQNIGCILLIYTCSNGNCNDSANHILQIIDCTPSCAVTVAISAVNCNLSSIITGTCPNPVYQWQIFQGGTWVAAPPPNNQSTYTGQHNQTYRLRVTGCPNCGAIFSNQITVSCPPVPACSISCVLTYNVALQRLQGVITNSGGSSGTMPYQFNRANNNTPLCTNCNGWQAPTCSGNVTIPAGGSIQINCNVPQIATEQCFRLVLAGGSCNNTQCCVKIPAIAALNCYELPTLDPFTDIVSLTVNGTNIINAAQFGCDEYESTEPVGTMNGTINCSLAQLAVDINQWLAANGHSGTAALRQSGKSCTLRVKDTNVVFNSVGSVNNGTISFIQSPSGCTLCDPVSSWHFQGCNSVNNFPSILYLNPDVAGSINLFTMLDLYFEEIPHTGTFTAAICTGVVTGCIDLSQNCCSAGAAPVTVNAGTGLLSWIPFNVPNENGRCFWTIRYLVTLPNGCAECIHITVNFDENL